MKVAWGSRGRGGETRKASACDRSRKTFFSEFESHPGLGLWVSLLHDHHTTAHTLLGNENKTRVWGSDRLQTRLRGG